MAIMKEEKYALGHHPALPPPPGTTGVIGWVRENLFSSVGNSIMTIVSIALLYTLIPPIVNWIFFDSVVNAGSREECQAINSGACWAVIKVRAAQFVYGFYPVDLRWRVDLFFLILVMGIILMASEKSKSRILLSYAFPGILLLTWFAQYLGGWQMVFGIVVFLVCHDLAVYWKDEWRKNVAIFMVLIFPVVSYFLLWGGLGLEDVESDKFGGFMLTILIGVTGIACSLPLGILLALGRQSKLPLIKGVCVVFIEFIRGVPLITLLFVASTLLNYFLPPGTYFDLLLRVLIMVTLFAAAYIAEVVRGGLQALPKGQYEGADSLGLSYWQSMGLIIMPQALKISIPGIVNTFIGLYKDTTLVLIIGLLDPLGLTQTILSDNNWNGLANEIYIFVALFFFVSCFAMSRYSLYLEQKLDTGHKR